jgi:cytochrome P450
MEIWATEPPSDPYFDPRLNAWMVSRYRDAAAALREPRLVPALARSTTPAVPLDSKVHTDFRTQALRALSPASIHEWEERFALAANAVAGALPTGVPVDLIEQYARPWSLQAAAIAANIPANQCARLTDLARHVFQSACEPYDEALATAAQEATVELAACFQHTAPWTMQMFIALAHSLPAFLGNAWLALLEQPAEITDLPRAIDELLRLAGPAKAQFRQAVAPVTIGDAIIERNQHVIIRLDIANRDPDEFPAPLTLQFDRRAPGHLAFGSGLHACVGSALVKSAAVVATAALLDRFHFAESYTAVPVDAFAVRYLRALNVTLTSRYREGST